MSFAVIIPSRTTSNFVECLTALREHEPTAQVYAIDDGLSLDDHTQDENHVDCWLCFMDPVYVIEGKKPFIFSRNVNLGINRAMLLGLDGVIILGDDGLLESPGGFSLLAEECRKDPSIGVIGCTTNLGHRCQKPQGVGLRFVDHFAFVAVYIPRTTIEKVGLLDERFNTYGWEDNDYTHRVRLAGLKCAVHDGCYVDHGSLVSTFRGDPRNPAELASGRAIFEAKWPGVPQ